MPLHRWWCLPLLLLLAPAAGAEPLKAYAHAKVLVGPEGERVTLVYLEPRDQNQVLVKFDNVRGEWDGKVVLHELKTSGDKEDYLARSEKHYVSVTQRAGSFEAYPKGDPKEIRLTYSDKESQAVKVEEIVAQYEKAPTEPYKKKR